jgi:hypothetical protein
MLRPHITLACVLTTLATGLRPYNTSYRLALKCLKNQFNEEATPLTSDGRAGCLLLRKMRLNNRKKQT